MSRHVLTRDGVVVYDYADPVVTTPPVVPPVTPPTTPPAGVEMRPFPLPFQGGDAAWFHGSQGISYAMPMPMTGSGRGQIAMSGEGPLPLPGADGHWEVSLSKIAGDFTQCKAYSVPGWGGAPMYPYYVREGGVSGGIKWIPFVGTGSYTGYPYIPQDGVQWYFNVRFLDFTGAVVMTYTPQ